MQRLLMGVVAALAVTAGIAFALRERIVLGVMERTVVRAMSTSILDGLPDGIHVALCGAGSPLPDPERSGPCVAVIAGQELYVVDAGAGSSRVLARMGVPQGRIQAVLLTHFHSDHIDGLGELLMQRWINGAHQKRTLVYGPRGLQRVVGGFRRAYSLDADYRIAHHGEEVAPPSGSGGMARPFTSPPDGQQHVVLESGGLLITAFRVDHDPVVPAVGYRFDYNGRSVVISGDTKKSANLEAMAREVDLLVHEALSPALVGLMNRAAARAGRANLEKITADIVDYHTSPVEAAEIARDVGAKHLLYYHIVPPLPVAPLEAVFLDGVAEVYEGPVSLGRDGTFLSLPAGSDIIEERSLL